MRTNRLLQCWTFVLALALGILVLVSLPVGGQAASTISSAPGDLDPTFGNGGIVTTDLPSAVNAEGNASALQSDGKIVVAGAVVRADASGSRTDFAIARLNSDGSLDTSFGSGGRVTASFIQSLSAAAYAVALQPDGKIIVAGSIETPGASRRFALARYLPNGALDPSFGSTGQVVTIVGVDAGAYDIVVGSDGKLIVAGYAQPTSGATQDFALVRYLSDGTLDSGFGSGGIVMTDFGNTGEGANSVALQADGKIVLAGGIFNSDFAIARYLPNGSLDSTFGTGGKVTTDFNGQRDSAASLLVYPDGRLIAAGLTATNTQTDFALARYLSNGALDSSFGSGGKVITTFGQYLNNARALVLKDDGKVVAAGLAAGNCSQGNCVSSIALAQYLPDGSLDSSFGTGGKVTTNYGAYTYAAANSLHLQPDGNLVATGYVRGEEQINIQTKFTLARYQPNGSLDPTFGTGGKSSPSFYSSNAWVHDVALQADGKIVAVGPGAPYCFTGCYNPTTWVLTRYLPDGQLDVSFGSGGWVTTTFSNGGGQPHALAIQSDGKIVVAGHAQGTLSVAFVVVRYMPDGTLDTTFGNGGRVVTDLDTSTVDIAYAVAVQPDGKIVAGGYVAQLGAALVRYMPNGDLDTTFSNDGIVIAFVPGGQAIALSLGVQADGKLLAGGYTDNVCSGGGCTPEKLLLLRLQPTGEADAQFGTNGIVVTSLGNDRNARINDLHIQEDGKIVNAAYAGIACDNTCQSSDFGLVRYLPDGNLDPTFGTGGIVTTDFWGLSDSAQSLVMQGDGKVILGGGVLTPDFTSAFGLARYLPDGALDTTFGAGGKVTTNVAHEGGTTSALIFAAVPDATGRLVAGGSARQGSKRMFAVARYLTDANPLPTATVNLTPPATLIPSPTSLPTATPTPCVPGVFSDVPPGSTFHPFVTCLVNRGIVSGYADCTFRPNTEVTRGQLAKIVSNSANYQEDPGPQMFEDVPPAQTFYAWVNRLARRGHMSGYPCGGVGEPCGTQNLPYFRPGANATRGQTSKIVANAAGYNDPQSEQQFEDVPSTHTFYLWIQNLASRGIMGGYPCGGEGEPCGPGGRGYFRPQNNVTRGQSAKIVANSFFPGCQSQALQR